MIAGPGAGLFGGPEQVSGINSMSSDWRRYLTNTIQGPELSQYRQQPQDTHQNYAAVCDISMKKYGTKNMKKELYAGTTFGTSCNFKHHFFFFGSQRDENDNFNLPKKNLKFVSFEGVKQLLFVLLLVHI